MTSLQGKLMRVYVKYTGSQGAPDKPVLEKRAKLEKDARGLVKIPKGVSICPARVGEIPAEWLEAPGAETGAAILYLHGGGYTIGSPRTHQGIAGGIAKASGVKVLMLDYRLAPENPFPAALEDALAAYLWLKAQGMTHVIIGGDSAGGGLTLATCAALRDKGHPLPDALFCLSPWTDLSGSGESMQSLAKVDPWIHAPELAEDARNYAGKEKLDHPLISPLFSDPKGLPPTLIVVGSDEILLDDARRIAEKMKNAGVDARLEIWQGMWHVFQAFAPYVPEATRSINSIAAFIRENIK